MAIPKPITGKGGGRATMIGSAQSRLAWSWGQGHVQWCVYVGKAFLSLMRVLLGKVKGRHGGSEGSPQQTEQQVQRPRGVIG